MISLLYIPFCIWFGWLNAWWIAHKVNWVAGKKIRHFFNGTIHVCIACAVVYVCWKYKLPRWLADTPWQAGVCILLVARVFFTTTLNYFHDPRQPIDYVTMTPKGITDKVEQAVFGKNGWLPLLLAFGGLIVLLTI